MSMIQRIARHILGYPDPEGFDTLGGADPIAHLDAMIEAAQRAVAEDEASRTMNGPFTMAAPPDIAEAVRESMPERADDHARAARARVHDLPALFTPAADAKPVRRTISPRFLREQIIAARKELASVRRRLAELEDRHRDHVHWAAAHDHGQGQLSGPPVRYGVHLDRAGVYWMRRPDGWHRMTVTASTGHGEPFGQVQRLIEPDAE